MTVTIDGGKDSDIRAEYLSSEDLKIAASLLYQSYREDPVFMEIFHSEKPDYEQRLRSLIREELAVFWETKQSIVGLYSNENLIGVACINDKENGFESTRVWHWRLKMMLSAGYFSTKQMLEKEKIIEETVPFKSYHLLSLIAILPQYQHRGLGHYLISAINNVLEAHPTSEGIVVYATTERYFNLFKKAGYKVMDEVKIGNVSGSLMIHTRDK